MGVKPQYRELGAPPWTVTPPFKPTARRDGVALPSRLVGQRRPWRAEFWYLFPVAPKRGANPGLQHYRNSIYFKVLRSMLHGKAGFI